VSGGRSPSIIAAHLAADATAALLLHDHEGHFGDLDVVAQLAEALAHAITLRLAEIEDCDHAYHAGLELLKAEALRYLVDFAG
jgi:predicted alpha/beta-hydrolase family hydrolase